MRTLFTAFILVLLVNTLALGGLAAWLGTSGRLSKGRVLEAVDIFSPTLDEEAALEAEKEQANKDEQEMLERTLRLQQIAGGPVTPAKRIESLRKVDDVHRDMLERQAAEARALYRQLDMQRARLKEMREQLKSQQQAFDAAVAERVEQMEQEDFRQAVTMLEGITAKQAKAVFQQMLKDGDQAQVVAYLAAMEDRKASGVLKEFKGPNEVTQATQLIEQVRLRSERVREEAEL